MPTRKNPRAVAFDSPADVPGGSVGYFSTGGEPIEASKDEHDNWCTVTVREGVACTASRLELRIEVHVSVGAVVDAGSLDPAQGGG